MVPVLSMLGGTSGTCGLKVPAGNYPMVFLPRGPEGNYLLGSGKDFGFSGGTTTQGAVGPLTN